jgi:predicted ATPase
MIVTQLQAINWRNFRRIDVALEERVFAVGPNAGGKSNLLDIFHFMAAIVRPDGGLLAAVEERGGVSSIRCRAGKGNAFELRLTLGTPGGKQDEWVYALGVQPRSAKDLRPVLRHEQVWRSGRRILNRPDAADRRDPVRLEQTFLENVTTNGRFREVAVFFGGIAYRHLFPQSAREETRRSGGALGGQPADESVRAFLEEVMAAPARARAARIARIETALKLVLPQLESLSLARLNEGRLRLETIFQHWRTREGLSQDHFSDGTLRLISILWSLLENESLLLLEEPELSLHPSVVRHLPGLIYRLKRRRHGQVILTTHSQELLSDRGIDGREVLLCLPSREGGAEVIPAAALPDVEALVEGGLSLGEVVLPRSQSARIEELGFFQ